MPSLLLYGILALSIMAAIGTGVYKVKQWGADEVRAEWNEANRVAREKEQARAAKAAETKEKGDAKAKVVFRTIYKDVDRVVVEYRDKSCLESDGLRIARSAILGQIAPASEPDKPMRPAAGPDGRDSSQRP